MSFDQEEVFAKIGKRVQLHDYEAENFRTSFKTAVPAGTTGQVIHANLVSHLHPSTFSVSCHVSIYYEKFSSFSSGYFLVST
jgi:hypothetical protein